MEIKRELNQRDSFPQITERRDSYHSQVWPWQVFILQKVRSDYMYRIFAQLDGGEYLFVAGREELEEALHLVEGLSAYWPRKYVVRDSEGCEVDLTTYTGIEPERDAASSLN
jgi:hypothetical protein